MSAGSDAGGKVDVKPDVVPFANDRLACVDAHSYTDRTCLESGLSLRRGGRCLLGRPKDDEESISLCAHLDAAVVGERLAQDAPVLCERGRVALAQLTQQLRGAFNVSEEEGDGSGR